MTPEPGNLACTAAGGLLVDVEAERYRIAPEDARALIFSGRPAPVMRERYDSGSVVTELTLEGHAAVNPAGRAVVIRTRAGAWIVPLVSFRRVACGEEVRVPVFGLVAENEWHRGRNGSPRDAVASVTNSRHCDGPYGKDPRD